MACYAPLRAALIEGPQGRRLDFSKTARGKGLSLPCGRCIGCRLERARQWAVRIMHESKMHESSAFITLTYDPEHLPKDGSLSVEHCQLFLKRLRERIKPTRIRFFLCGEYGEELERPHYHAVVFGYDFPDKVQLPGSRKFPLFSSELLSAAWGHGFASIGTVSFDSAAYVANYATKKVTGDKAEAHYRGRKPEFLLMSRRPGIGRPFIDRYMSDVFPADEVIVNGKPARPPRYYDNVFKKDHEIGFEIIRARREERAEQLEEYVLKSGDIIKVAPGRNARRLAVREKVAQAKAALKQRTMEKRQ